MLLNNTGSFINRALADEAFKSFGKSFRFHGETAIDLMGSDQCAKLQFNYGQTRHWCIIEYLPLKQLNNILTYFVKIERKFPGDRTV